MQESTFSLKTADGLALFGYSWLPPATDSLRGVVQIAHGMGEHAGRYASLAEQLCAAGFGVYACDQRGHGRSVASEAELSHLGEADTWNLLVEDLEELHRHLRLAHPTAPVILLGHSMGSLLAQECLLRFGEALRGIVLSGSPGQAPLRGLAVLIARFERWRQGNRGQSRWLRALTFTKSNRAFGPTRTDFDWISRDPLEVDRYLADRHCGFVVDNQAFCDLLEGVKDLLNPTRLQRIAPQPALCFVAGDADPLNRNLKNLQPLLRAYRAAGLRVDSFFYPGGRHEMFHEINRAAVFRDLIAWLQRL